MTMYKWGYEDGRTGRLEQWFDDDDYKRGFEDGIRDAISVKNECDLCGRWDGDLKDGACRTCIIKYEVQNDETR